jgi:DNA-binding NtrC family response regulator
MTTGSCIALIGRNDEVAAILQARLREYLDLGLARFDFSTAADWLSWDNDGLILVAVENGADVRALCRLVQDVSLQQLPAGIAVLETAEFTEHHDTFPEKGLLAALTPYLAARLRWPVETEEIIKLAEDFGRCYYPFAGKDNQPLEEVLRRQLQGLTPSLLPLADRLALAARHDITVLLTGDTGTGKTHFSRLIHQYSPRHEHRFLQISCGAIAANLVESEFFGHIKGAFTGADRNKLGKFAAVGRGTLLMDEIDTLPLEQQATLLRVIETGEFEPVGSVETQKCQARLIVASNIHLEEAVEDGTFRPDLYFRLNVMSFHLPPLRERVQDIAPLARAMAARFNRKFEKELFSLSPQALTALESYTWPGNIRQLENAIQHAVLVSNGPELHLRDLPEAIQENALERRPAEPAGHSLKHQRKNMERDAIYKALVTSGYSRSRAAKLLGISRVTLYKKMKKYDLTAVPHTPTTKWASG